MRFYPSFKKDSVPWRTESVFLIKRVPVGTDHLFCRVFLEYRWRPTFQTSARSPANDQCFIMSNTFITHSHRHPCHLLHSRTIVKRSPSSISFVRVVQSPVDIPSGHNHFSSATILTARETFHHHLPSSHPHPGISITNE